MKNRLFFLVWLAFTTIRCSDDTGFAEQEKINFSFTFLSDSEGRIGSADLPAGSSLVISVSTSDGTSVLSHHKIEILRMGDHFISSPIELKPGRYNVDDFMIVDGNSQVLFATPKRASKLASLVDHSLPFSFTVSTNSVTTVNMQVIDAALHDPEAFGYASFNIDLVHPFLISVFTAEHDELTFTEATLTVETEEMIHFTYALDARVNFLSFEGDPTINYRLRIQKDGFKDSFHPFNYEEYATASKGKSIKVVLQKEVCSFKPAEDPKVFLTFKGAGNLYVAWGDGNVDHLVFTAGSEDPDNLSFRQLSHQYNNDLKTITISGDFDQIVEFISATTLENVMLSALSNLENLTLESSHLNNLDLSENKRLNSISFINTQFETVTFPSTHLINNVYIEGLPAAPTLFDLEKIIDEVFRNAVKQNITEGAFILFNVGDLPSAAAGKLSELETAYSWYVEVE